MPQPTWPKSPEDAPPTGQRTPRMLEAGIERLFQLLDAGTGSAYVVSEVYGVMREAQSSSPAVAACSGS
jgi:hypothetical protein